MERLRPPAPDPHMRRRPITMQRPGRVRRKPAVGIASAKLGLLPTTVGKATAPAEPLVAARMLAAADIAPARRTAGTMAEAARVPGIDPARHTAATTAEATPRPVIAPAPRAAEAVHTTPTLRTAPVLRTAVVAQAILVAALIAAAAAMVAAATAKSSDQSQRRPAGPAFQLAVLVLNSPAALACHAVPSLYLGDASAG